MWAWVTCAGRTCMAYAAGFVPERDPKDSCTAGPGDRLYALVAAGALRLGNQAGDNQDLGLDLQSLFV